MYQALIEGVEIAFGPRMPPPPPVGLCYSQPFFSKQVSACDMRQTEGGACMLHSACTWCIRGRLSHARPFAARALPPRQYHLPPLCVEGQARETEEYKEMAKRAAQA